MESVTPHVLHEGSQEDKGETARLQYFVGAIATGDLVRSTLGPKGMDKILQPIMSEASRHERSIVTNDGATILKSVWIDNPAAKILVDVARQQDVQCGDGTTGVVILAAEILKNAERLVEQKIHPQVLCVGIREATVAARRALDERVTVEHSDTAELEKALFKVATTTLSSKLVYQEKEHFANLAVRAILRLKGQPNLNYIQVLKKCGGTMRDSYLEDGFILEKKIGVGQPKAMKGCKVLVANTPMDTDKIKIYGTKVAVDSFDAVHEIELAERAKMKSKVDKILAHECNVFINRQLIYNYPDQLFKDAGVMAIEHSDFEGMERLAAVLGADILSTFDEPKKHTLGTCDMIDEIMIGEDRLIRFSGCQKNEACTIILRGANQHVLDEAERSLHDALAVLSQTAIDHKVVLGGGAAEMAMADAVEGLARTVEGKKSLAIEAFAQALRQIPATILENGGFDAADAVTRLRAAHTRGEYYMGIDMRDGGIADMREVGVLESHKAKLSQICAASEAAEMIVRVDDIIRCAPRKREGM